MGKSSVQSYFCRDLRRIFERKETWLAVVGVVASLFFALEKTENFDASVIYVFVFSTESAGFILTFIFCALPYGGAYSEDLETHYIRYMVGRGNLRNYCLGRTLSVFLSSVFIMTAGCVFFGILCHSRLEWLDADTYEQLAGWIGYRGWLTKGWYLPWFIIYGLQWGLYAAVLTLAAAFCSLFISNRMLVLIVPALLDQLLVELGATRAASWLYPRSVFNAGTLVTGSEWKDFAWAFLFSAIASLILAAITEKKLKERM